MRKERKSRKERKGKGRMRKRKERKEKGRMIKTKGKALREKRRRDGKGGSERKQLLSRKGTVMSEEASVNTGAVDWPGQDRAWWAVRRMQTKLHCWAAEDSREESAEDAGRRFDDLYNLSVTRRS